jgi:hypothetical protein
MKGTTAMAAAVLCVTAGGRAGAARAEDGWKTDLTICGGFTGIEGDIRAPAFGLGVTSQEVVPPKRG